MGPDLMIMDEATFRRYAEALDQEPGPRTFGHSFTVGIPRTPATETSRRFWEGFRRAPPVDFRARGIAETTARMLLSAKKAAVGDVVRSIGGWKNAYAPASSFSADGAAALRRVYAECLGEEARLRMHLKTHRTDWTGALRFAIRHTTTDAVIDQLVDAIGREKLGRARRAKRRRRARRKFSRGGR